MAAQMKKNESWDNPPIHTFKEDEMDKEQDKDEGLDLVTEKPLHNVEPYTSQDTEDAASSFQQLAGAGITGENLKAHLKDLHSAALYRLPSTDLPHFDVDHSKCHPKTQTPIASIALMLKSTTTAKRSTSIKQQLCGFYKKVRESPQIIYSEYEAHSLFLTMLSLKQLK